jgi:hypothetical protein
MVDGCHRTDDVHLDVNDTLRGNSGKPNYIQTSHLIPSSVVTTHFGRA